MSTLEKIKALVDNATSLYKGKYYSDSETFTDSYVNAASGLIVDVTKAELTYPIQYEVDGNFYFFATAEDLYKYIVMALDEEGMVYNEDDDYYDSSEYEDSGC